MIFDLDDWACQVMQRSMTEANPLQDSIALLSTFPQAHMELDEHFMKNVMRHKPENWNNGFDREDRITMMLYQLSTSGLLGDGEAYNLIVCAPYVCNTLTQARDWAKSVFESIYSMVESPDQFVFTRMTLSRFKHR